MRRRAATQIALASNSMQIPIEMAARWRLWVKSKISRPKTFRLYAPRRHLSSRHHFRFRCDMRRRAVIPFWFVAVGKLPTIFFQASFVRLFKLVVYIDLLQGMA
jgi:hypothetical protein